MYKKNENIIKGSKNDSINMNEVLETINGLTISVDELELINKNLSNKIGKMNLYKILSSNANSMICMHCSKTILTTVFLEHLQICQNYNFATQNTSEDYLQSESYLDTKISSDRDIIINKNNNPKEKYLQKSSNMDNFMQKNSQEINFEENKFDRDNKMSVLTYDIYENRTSSYISDEDSFVREKEKSIYQKHLDNFKRKITDLKNSNNSNLNNINTMNNKTNTQEEINEILTKTKISNDLQKKNIKYHF